MRTVLRRVPLSPRKGAIRCFCSIDGGAGVGGGVVGGVGGGVGGGVVVVVVDRDVVRMSSLCFRA